MGEQFSPAARAKLRAYVYALAEPGPAPLLERLFYIGKGEGDRAFAHARGVTTDPNIEKRDRILAILAENRAPEILVIQHGLSARVANRLEAQLIKVIGNLTNRVQGHSSRAYWLEPREIEAMHNEPVQAEALGRRMLFVQIGGSNERDLPAFDDFRQDEDALRDRTLSHWRLDPNNAANVDTVIGCAGGLARCAYRVSKDDLEPVPNEPGRYRWRQGERDHDLEENIKEREVFRPDGSSITNRLQSVAYYPR